MTRDRGPIFIGGLSHSGKTELRLVLSAHPELSLTRRTYMWDRFFGRFGDLDRDRNLDRCLATMLRDAGVRALEPDEDQLRQEFRQGPATYARLFALVHQHHAERLGKRRWGEQLGFVERFADPIFSAYPTARMIHMIRDPRDRETLAATGRKPGRVGWETARWLRSAELAERNRRRYGDGYRVVRYETFASRPVQTMRELCAFIDEVFLPGMEEVLATVSFDGPGATDPERRPVRRAVQASTVDVAFVNRYARRQLPAFGYPVTEPALSPREHLAFLLVDQPVNRAAMAAWHIVGAVDPAWRAGR